MRIISGKYKGKYIYPPKNFKARPTTDIAKESLFNILSNNFDFNEITVLDLFSGTGSISYEFASRECKKIIAIEAKYQHYQFIKKTIDDLQLKQINIYKTDVFIALKKINEKFDIIFADPPYNLENLYQLPTIIFKNNLLKSGGWFILEHGKKNIFTDHNNFIETRQYGSVHFSIFQ